jgi:glycosyltransferase involved in cell wall biosynthesis
LRKITVAVTNDLAGDNRVHRVCETLAQSEYEVVLTGRRYRNSAVLAPRLYRTTRMLLLFRKGPLFYAEYNIRLFIRLLFSRNNLILANDLDTLPAAIAAGIIRNTPVIYDSHEYFTEVPELMDRQNTRSVWLWLERMLLPRVKAAYTVSQSIADSYFNRYHIPFAVIRNLPFARTPMGDSAEKQNPHGRPAIIYQGALNAGRGLEHVIRAMEFIPEADLIIAGSGDKEAELKKLAAGSAAGNIRFTGRLPLEKLAELTRQASLGISVEEDLGLSYRFALPNKLFDYIQAEIPVVVSNLPEMRSVVEQYGIGLVAESHQPEYLAETFRKALFDVRLRTEWQAGLTVAASTLTWENEKKSLLEIFSRF